MVSPFMSFATGALQAVNQNIDRYRAQKAAEEEREDAAAQRMKELQFQRDTTYEVEKRRQDSAYDIEELKQKGIDAKNRITIGGFSYLRDAKNPDLEANNFISQAQANPEAFEAAYNDATTKNQIVAEAMRHFGTIRRGVGIYSQKDKFGPSYEGRLPNNHVPSQLRQISKITNPLILKLGDQFNSDTATMRGDNPSERTSPPTNTVYSKQENGTVKDFNLDGVEGIDNALRAFRGVNLGYDRMNDTSLKRKFMERIVGKFGSNKLNKKKIQRIVSAAGNSDVMNYISGEAQPTREQKEGALAFFQDPKNGFVDENTGLIDTDNFVNFVSLFGMQNAGTAFAGTEPEQERFSAINKGRIAKELTAVSEVGLAAEAANKTIKEVERMIDQGVTVGGKVAEALTRAPFEIGAFTKDIGRITETLFMDRGHGVGKILGANNIVQDSVSKKAFKMLDTADKELKAAEQAFSKDKSIVKRRALAAAQLEMLELVLAYQITGILQGGTGGRTISDTDITRALKMFSSRFGDVEGRKKKLAFVQKLVTSSINKKRVFAILNNRNVNADMYQSVQRASRLLNLGIDQDNLTTEAAKFAGEQEDLSNRQGILNQILNPKNPIAKENYNQETYAAGIDKVTRKDGQGELAGNFVINSDDLALWKNAVARFRVNRDSEELERARQKIIERGGTMAFDAAQGIEVPINWTIRDGEAGFDTGGPMKTPDSGGDPVASPVVQAPAADSSLAAKGRKPSGKGRTSATTDAAIIKLFETKQPLKRPGAGR